MTLEYHIVDEKGNKVKRSMNLGDFKSMLTKPANKKETGRK